jgi:hypothetical protein
MATESAVLEELKSEFKGIEEQPAFLDSCAKIGALLSGGYGNGPISEALKTLNDLMFKVIDGRLKDDVKQQLEESARRENIFQTAKSGAFSPKDRGIGKIIGEQTSPMTISRENPFKKVLTTALIEFEHDFGYPVNQDEFFHPSYVAFVSAETFLGNIGQGFHWKDVGASPDHGEFTHRLQWFTIAASQIVPKATIGSVYRDIGTCGLKSEKPDGFDQHDLWARLFDRPMDRLSKGRIGAAESGNDYRCPEQFNSFLRGGSATFPLLSSFLAARHSKRAAGDSDAFPTKGVMQDYCARKMFKSKSYANLLPPQKEEVDKVISSGVLLMKK